MLILDEFNKLQQESWRPYITKEELLEKYWTKFLLYLYQSSCKLIEIQEFDEELNKNCNDRKKNGETILEKYWVVYFAMYMSFILRWTAQATWIAEVYGELFFQDLIENIAF